MKNRIASRSPWGFAAWLLLASTAWGQSADPPQRQGNVKSVLANRSSFVITERRTGVEFTIPVNRDTRYVLGGKDGADFVDVVVISERITAVLDPKGVALEVRNRSNERLPVARLKELLGATHEEAVVLSPAITRVMKAKSLLAEAYQSGNGDDEAPDPAEVLKRVLRSSSATPSDLRTSVALLRDQRKVLLADFKRAAQELTSLLTIRQEAILVQMGILE